MDLFRSIRNVYDRTVDHYYSNIDLSNNQETEKRIKFEVKLKINNKYESRSLEIARHFDEPGRKQWKLYVIKNADYTSYDCYVLSETFITQLFNTKNCKCIVVFVEDVLEFKMNNLSDKWRFVEFIRANVENDAHTFEGTLENFPNKKKNQNLSVQILFKQTCLVIIEKSTQKMVGSFSLIDFEMYSFRHDKLSFVCRNAKQDTSEYWSIRAENMEKLADVISEANEITHRKEQSNYVQLPSFDSIYTDF